MGSFVFVSYQGEDAGVVLSSILTDEEDDEKLHDVQAMTQRIVGFQRREEEEDDEEEEGDAHAQQQTNTDKHRP